jgi:epoxide hydrolase-like predicted phosphatase
MSIEALVFDIGNVLVPFDWQIFHRRLRADCPNLPTEAEKQFRELVIRIEVGEMTGETFTEQAVRAIGFQGDQRTFLSIWNGIFSSNIPMERTILDLKERFPLFLLSNTSELHLAYLMQNWDVLQHFLDGVYSFRAKCAKPDRRIFETAIKQFGLRPENTVYIDDLPANIDSALNLGFKAIRYDLTKHAEFEERLAELEIGIPELPR